MADLIVKTLPELFAAVHKDVTGFGANLVDGTVIWRPTQDGDFGGVRLRVEDNVRFIGMRRDDMQTSFLRDIPDGSALKIACQDIRGSALLCRMLGDGVAPADLETKLGAEGFGRLR